MALSKYEIDCTQEGIKGYNTTDHPTDKLQPYLYRIDVNGNDFDASLGVDDPAEAKFNVVEMTDVRVEIADYDDTEATVFFKAIVEFDLDYVQDWDDDDESSGKFVTGLLEEAGWTVHVSSNTLGFETPDGEKDNFAFDGTLNSVKVPLKKL